MRPLLVLLAALPALLPAGARADGHGVTIVNAGTDTIRRIEIGSTENRLRSQVPPGASARITYSTRCTADVRLGYDGGRTESFTNIDICTDPRITTGQGVTGQGVTGQGVTSSTPKPGTKAAGSTPAPVTPVVAPPPVVPPWTGKSITKRFGGMD